MTDSRYDVLERLGEGGAGAVFKAWDKRLQRHVAFKRLLPPEERAADGVGTDLYKEAAALSALQHPNVVSVFDLAEIDGQLCVIMEFINGETLETTMKRGALNPRDFSEVARQSLEGLLAAHKLGIQHRDIKPSNIMVNWLPNGDFLVKMLDFGLADFSVRPHLQVKEGENSTYGSVHFMAPEQFTRRPVDVRTDLYSLGCVLYYAMTGAYPFQGNSMEAVIEAHLHPNISPLASLRKDVPAPWCNWVQWLMNFRPEDRPANAEIALESFKQILAVNPGQLPSGPRPTQPVNAPPKTAPVTVVPPRTTGPIPTRPQPAQSRPSIAMSPAVVPPPAKVKKPLPKNLLITLGSLVVLTGIGIAYLMNGSDAPADGSDSTTSKANDPSTILLKAENAKINGSGPKVEGTNIKNIGYWIDPKVTLSWTVQIDKPGDYEATIEYSLDRYGDGNEISLGSGIQPMKATLSSTGTWYIYKKAVMGKMTINQQGPVVITLTPLVKKGSGVMNLRTILLRRL